MLAAAIFCGLCSCGLVIGIKDISLATNGDSGNDAEAEGDATGEADAGDASDGGVTDASDADCGDASDSLNCGRCGHDCLGGACASGRCQPVVLASGQGEVFGIALDATHVYFSSLTGSFIARVPKKGGAVDSIANAPNADLAKRVAVDKTHVYWGNTDLGDGAIKRCVITGCTTAETLATPSEPTGLALTPGHVVWADRNGQAIRRRPLDGGAEELLASPPDLPVSVAVDGPLAFWISDFSGQVFRNVPADGGVEPVAVAGVDGRDLALDATHVYWAAAGATGGPGNITRIARTGGGTTPIGPANGDPHSLAVDATHVVWTSWARASDGGVLDGGVFACPVAGCGGSAPEPLATAQNLPRGVAIDDTAVYWGTNGFVLKVARP